MKEVVNERTMSDELKNKVSDLQRRFRIFCLSENDHSLLMWSHYAEHHRGVVLGFDTNALEEGLMRPTQPVDYLENLPMLIDWKKHCQSIALGTNPPPIEENGRKWTLAKHSDWAYEKEWRIVTAAEKGTPGMFHDCSIPKNSVTEIVYGCRIDENLRIKISNIATSLFPRIKEYQMKMHASQFALVKHEIDESKTRQNTTAYK